MIRGSWVFAAGAWLVATACSPSPSSPVEQGPAARVAAGGHFNSYLKRNFNQSIPGEPHTYIILPAKGCASCNRTLIRAIVQQLVGKKVTLVTSQRELQRLSLLPASAQVLYDTTALPELDRLELPFPNFTGLIRTRDGEVTSFSAFHEGNAESVLAGATATDRP
ncbi:hypothetical protein [Hymenobacter koreensis]|uniref:Redoxin domain-containing protein n=1 Tax=Hymenobacter koreensis TaxID=1084523 RepID=A0ABP8IYF9_9BACT